MIASRSLLQMSAKFRANYLRNFAELNRASAQTGANPEQPLAYVIFAGQGREETVSRFLEILMSQGIEVYKMNRELKTSIAGSNAIHTEVPLGSFLVFLDQPQRNNVEALFGRQIYPHRVDEKGNIDQPYDVAGWTLPLQMGIEYYTVTQIVEYPNSERQLEKMTDINQARQTLNLEPARESFQKLSNPLKSAPKIGIYKGFAGSMDEGWTRWTLDTFQIPFQSATDADMRNGNLNARFDAIILPSQTRRTNSQRLERRKLPEGINRRNR